MGLLPPAFVPNLPVPDEINSYRHKGALLPFTISTLLIEDWMHPINLRVFFKIFLRNLSKCNIIVES